MGTTRTALKRFLRALHAHVTATGRREKRVTKLNDDQLEKLDRVRTGATHLEIKLAQLKEQYEYACDLAKNELRYFASRARKAGVPMRQIGFALGTSDHKTIQDMTTVRELAKPEGVEAEDSISDDWTVVPGIEWIDDKVFLVTDSTPTTWEFWAIVIDGVALVNESDTTSRATNEGAELSEEAKSLVEGAFEAVEWGD